MRKILSIILALITVCCMSALAACGKHEHAYDTSKWETDATSHWHVCTGEDCEEVGDKADHTFASKTSAEKHWQECNVCGVKKDEVNHTFVEKHNATQYWSECSECGYQQEKITATVDSATLANAILFKDAEGNYYTNFEANCTGYNTSDKNVTKKIKFTGDKLYKYDSTHSSSEPLAIIYANTSEGSSKYTKNGEDVGWTETTSTGKYTIISLAPTIKGTVFMYGTDDYVFEYNEENNTYSASKAREGASSNNKYTLKFANGKLVGVVVEVISNSTQQASIRYSWTLSYGNTTIELPEVSE